MVIVQIWYVDFDDRLFNPQSSKNSVSLKNFELWFYIYQYCSQMLAD